MKKNKIKALISLLLVTTTGCNMEPKYVDPPKIKDDEFINPVKKFRIVFLNGDGSRMFNRELDEGESLVKYADELYPVKASDGDRTYVFSHWNPEPTTVANDQIFTPVFNSELNEYFTLTPNSDNTGYIITSFNRASITTVDIPRYESENSLTITGIADNAFKGKHNIEVINLGSNVQTIGNSAFENCSSLRRVTYKTLADDNETIITPQLRQIGDRAFANCTALKNIDSESNANSEVTKLPSELETIGTNAFEKCLGIKSIVIPKNVSSIGTKIFKSCPNLISLAVDAENSNYGSADCNLIYRKNNGAIIEGCKRSSFNSNQLISVEDNVFDSIELVSPNATDPNVFDSVSSITFPSSFTSFGKESFKNNLSLTSITINGPVKKFYTSTFEGCSNISNLVINDSTGDFISSYNSVIRVKVSDATDTENVGEIVPSTGDEATNYSELPRLIYGTVGTSQIDSRVKSIGKRAFYKSNVQNIVFTSTKAVAGSGNNDLVSIDDEAFRECAKLETLKIYFPGVSVQRSAMQLPLSLCRGCTSLTSFVIPPAYSSMKLEEDETKGNGSFVDCTNLSEIAIHGHLSVIYENTFTNCRNISKVKFSGSVDEWNKRKNPNNQNIIVYKSRGNETVLNNTGENVYEYDSLDPFSVGVLP